MELQASSLTLANSGVAAARPVDFRYVQQRLIDIESDLYSLERLLKSQTESKENAIISAKTLVDLHLDRWRERYAAYTSLQEAEAQYSQADTTLEQKKADLLENLERLARTLFPLTNRLPEAEKSALASHLQSLESPLGIDQLRDVLSNLVSLLNETSDCSLHLLHRERRTNILEEIRQKHELADDLVPGEVVMKELRQEDREHCERRANYQNILSGRTEMPPSIPSEKTEDMRRWAEEAVEETGDAGASLAELLRKRSGIARRVRVAAILLRDIPLEENDRREEAHGALQQGECDYNALSADLSKREEYLLAAQSTLRLRLQALLGHFRESVTFTISEIIALLRGTLTLPLLETTLRETKMNLEGLLTNSRSEKEEHEKQEVRVHIRWMIRRDMPEVFAIERDSFEFPWCEEDFVRCLKQRNCIGMVAEHDDRIIGFMIYELNKQHIHLLNLAAAGGMRRKGVATQMIAKLIGKLSIQRRDRVILETREMNKEAQLFFRANGFRVISTLRDFYDDTSEDAYIMAYRYRDTGCSMTLEEKNERHKLAAFQISLNGTQRTLSSLANLRTNSRQQEDSENEDDDSAQFLKDQPEPANSDELDGVREAIETFRSGDEESVFTFAQRLLENLRQFEVLEGRLPDSLAAENAPSPDEFLDNLLAMIDRIRGRQSPRSKPCNPGPGKNEIQETRDCILLDINHALADLITNLPDTCAFLREEFPEEVRKLEGIAAYLKQLRSDHAYSEMEAPLQCIATLLDTMHQAIFNPGEKIRA
jgi:ribosomal-protein-alanine N-acetyltransferase